MKYLPGNIIKYKQNFGPNKVYYGIVIEEINKSCVKILTESKPEKVVQIFTDPKTTTSLSIIEKILSLEEYSKIIEDEPSYLYDTDKKYLFNIAKVLSHNKETIKFSNKKYLETIANLVNR